MIVDLRSDTLTTPTQAMRKAMAEAEVGDDVFKEDPTVNKLQLLAANKFGKEDALFVPTGTMGNLTSVLVHCWGRGCEVYLGEDSHIYKWEQGGIAQLGSVYSKGIRTFSNGKLDFDDLRVKYRLGDNIHHSIGRMIVLENTSDGRVLSPEYFRKARAVADDLKLVLHMDGARIANACAALKCDVMEFTKHVDSACICLSKGLGAPVGSVIVGSKDFITKARRIRKVLGGGMRQVGVLAAAGIIALTDMWSRISEDHDKALQFGEEISKLSYIQLDLSTVQSNMVVFTVKDDAPFTAIDIVDKLKEPLDGNTTCVKTITLSQTRVRAVFYHSISNKDVQTAIAKFKLVHQIFTTKE